MGSGDPGHSILGSWSVAPRWRCGGVWELGTAR